MWAEDPKTPIMTTKYHASYLTAAVVAHRCGVFWLPNGWRRGYLGLFYSQNEVATRWGADAALSVS